MGHVAWGSGLVCVRSPCDSRAVDAAGVAAHLQRDTGGLLPLMQENETVAQHPERHSLLPIPEGIVIPGARFRELYYWWAATHISHARDVTALMAAA